MLRIAYRRFNIYYVHTRAVCTNFLSTYFYIVNYETLLHTYMYSKSHNTIYIIVNMSPLETARHSVSLCVLLLQFADCGR